MLITMQRLESETTREKNLDKAQKEAKTRARKEGAKSIYLKEVHDIALLAHTEVLATHIVLETITVSHITS